MLDWRQIYGATGALAFKPEANHSCPIRASFAILSQLKLFCTPNNIDLNNKAGYLGSLLVLWALLYGFI